MTVPSAQIGDVTPLPGSAGHVASGAGGGAARDTVLDRADKRLHVSRHRGLECQCRAGHRMRQRKARRMKRLHPDTFTESIPALYELNQLEPGDSVKVCSALEEPVGPGRSAAAEPYWCDILLRVPGGFQVKVGQMISMQKGLLPDEVTSVLAACCEAARSLPLAAVRAQLEAQLGRPLERDFADVEEQPLASASVGSGAPAPALRPVPAPAPGPAERPELDDCAAKPTGSGGHGGPARTRVAHGTQSRRMGASSTAG